jgi:transposase
MSSRLCVQARRASGSDLANAPALSRYVGDLRRVGHEAGSLSPWVQVELQQRGLPAVCPEAYHPRAALAAMSNKTDCTDAQGIAHILRTGWFKQVHVKSEENYRLRLLLPHQRNLKRTFLDIEKAIRHSIKTFGLKLGAVSRGKFEACIRELTEHDALIAGIADCILRARAALWREYLRLLKLVVKAVSKDDVFQRFMGIPGIGPIDALAFKTSVDNPQRFRR